jgi:hypothetical protein
MGMHLIPTVGIDDQVMSDGKQPTKCVTVVTLKTTSSLPGKQVDFTSNILNFFEWTTMHSINVSKDDQLCASVEMAKGFCILKRWM